MLATRQTSLVVDPPDGRVPVKPSAEARRDDYAARNADSYEFMSPWDRCITRGIPGSMFPAGYNNAYQIIQTPGYVTIHYEMIHDARIIPLDNRPRSARMQTWMGEPRGRWEGDTLVVETTNYHNKGWITTSAASGRIKGIPHSDKLHVIERFKRVSKDVISYSATIEDPEIYTRPWTISFPLTADPDYRIYEYACHEGNYAIENILRGARAVEKAGEVTEVTPARQRKRQQRRARGNDDVLPAVEHVGHRRGAPDRCAGRVAPQVLARCANRTP